MKTVNHKFEFFLCILRALESLWQKINQKQPFMQNKANLLDSQMNVSSVLTKDYENEHLRRGWKNKAKQTQSNQISPFPSIQDNFSFNYLREIYAGGFLRQRTNQSAIISVVSNEMIERNN